MLPLIILAAAGTAASVAVYEKRKNPSWTPFSTLFATPRRLREALDRVRVTSVPTPAMTAALDPHMTAEEATHVNNVLVAEIDPAKIHDHAEAAHELGLPNSAKALTAKAEAVGDAKAAGATDADVHNEQIAATAMSAHAAGWYGESWPGWNDAAGSFYTGACATEAQLAKMSQHQRNFATPCKTQNVPKHYAPHGGGGLNARTHQQQQLQAQMRGSGGGSGYHVPGPRDLHQQQLDRQRARRRWQPQQQQQQQWQPQDDGGGAADDGGGGGVDQTQLQQLQQQILQLQQQAAAAKRAAQTAADAATDAATTTADAAADAAVVSGPHGFFGREFRGFGRPGLAPMFDWEGADPMLAESPVLEEYVRPGIVARPEWLGDWRRGRHR